MKKIISILLIALACSTTAMAAKKVAFVYQKGYNASKINWGVDGYTPDSDPTYKALCDAFEVTVFMQETNTVEADYETLRTFDAVVLSEAMSGNSTLTNKLVGLVGTVPMVSMKAFNYTSGRWGWATPKNPSSKCTSVTIADAFTGHALFKDLTVGAGNVVELYDGTSTASNMVQGFDLTTLIDGNPIDQEKILATTTIDGYASIHELEMNGFKYVLVPLSSDLIATANDNAGKLIVNAVNYVMGDNDNADTENMKIAYLYDSSYSNYCGIDNDPFVQNTVISERDFITVDVKDFTAENTDTLDALATNYDIVVVSEAIGGTHAFGVKLASIINRTPMLNFKSFFYKSGRWGVGAGQNPAKTADNYGNSILNVAAGSEEHEIFANVDIEDDGSINMFVDNEVTNNLMQAYTVTETSLFYNDSVLATVGGYNAIHEHGLKNTYMLIPISSDAIYRNEDCNLSESAIQIINNAIDYLAATKANVVPCATPKQEVVYENLVTKVTLSTATKEASIYYTTDGTEPTVKSALYTEPFEVTVDSTVVNAIAVRQGYDNSEVLKFAVSVFGMAAAPVISMTDGEGGKLVTITSPEEGGAIYYNLRSTTPTTASNLYTEPFLLTRSSMVYAITAVEDKLNSEIVSAAAYVPGYVVRENVLAYANFKDAPGEWSYMQGDTLLVTGKSEIFKQYAYTEKTDTTEASEHKTVDYNNGWMVGTRGQRVYLQNTGVSAVVGEAYGPATPDDEGATGSAMSLMQKKNANEPSTAYLRTTTKYQGPFDVHVWFLGQVYNIGSEADILEALEVAVSTDAENWTVLDTLSTISVKKMRHQVAYYDGNEEVYMKIQHAGARTTNGYKSMIFDVKLMGEGGQLPDAIKEVNEAAELVSTSYYTVSGMALQNVQKGLNIVRKVYSNGTVEVKKIFVK